MKNVASILTLFLFLLPGKIFPQVIADFESPEKTPTLTPAQAMVKINPSKSGINTSDYVAYFTKPASDWQALYLGFTAKISVGQNDRLVFKLYTSTVGRVYVKVGNGSAVTLEGWAPEYNFQPPANSWVECSLDISALKGTEFDRLEINASVNNSAAANVYVDDIRLANSLALNGEPVIVLTVSDTKVTTGSPIEFDASGSYDADGNIISWNWDFGNENTATGSVVSNTYEADGIYEVSVVVTDNEHKSSRKTFYITILDEGDKVSSLTIFTPTPYIHSKIEAGFILAEDYSNPYVPEIVSVDAEIKSPSGSIIKVPCFYYQKGYYQPVGDKWVRDELVSYWMLRFSTSEPGLHQITLVLKDASGTIRSSANQVQVIDHAGKGIIHMDQGNLQYYRHTTGEPYYPLGINAAWDNTSNYTTILTNLSKGKANLVRYWQVPFDRQGLEWKNGSGFYKGLGIYSQEAAAEQDSILALCEVNGLYLQLVIFQHGMFSENVNSNWNDNPYNVVNGGPLAKAEQFFYNPEARQRTKKLLRYIIARWGYSTNLFAWELFNEVQFTGMHNQQSSQWYPGVLAWHDEMGKYIKSIDPFNHLVSTSAEDNQMKDMDVLEGLDNLQYHLYHTNLLSVQLEKDKSLVAAFKNKGLINGEYGLDVNTADVPFDVQRISIWSGIFSHVPHLMWLWENYKNQTWANLFLHPSAYTSNEDFVKEGPHTTWIFYASQGSAALKTSGFYTSETNYYGMLYDVSHRSNLSGGSLLLPSVPYGIYNLELWDLTSGLLSSAEIDIHEGATSVSLPMFHKGMAIKLKLKSFHEVTATENVSNEKSVQVYPNPSAGKIRIRMAGENTACLKVSFHDSAGRSLFTGEDVCLVDGSTDIDLSGLKLRPGVYYLHLRMDYKTIVKRVVLY